jgi:hypothetical protein
MSQEVERLRAEYWRLQAKRAQSQADLMHDPVAKGTMLEIVQKYEAMADREVRREVIRHLRD